MTKIPKVGMKIRKLRELRNFTQTDMASKLNLSLNAYGKVEREETELSLSRLHEIAKILEVPIFELLDFDENKFIFNQHYKDTTTNIAYQEIKTSFEHERKQYENHISDLKAQLKQKDAEIERLHALLEKTLTK